MGSPGRITVPSVHRKLPLIVLPFSSSVLPLSKADPPIVFDSTAKTDELFIWNEPLIVFPGQARRLLSGSPIVPSNVPSGMTVTSVNWTLP